MRLERFGRQGIRNRDIAGGPTEETFLAETAGIFLAQLGAEVKRRALVITHMCQGTRKFPPNVVRLKVQANK